MLDFEIDNSPVCWTGVQQAIGIPMYTKCGLLLADLFLQTCEADFLHGLLKNKDSKLVQTFNSSIRYIDYVLSLNNSRFGGYLHHI